MRHAIRALLGDELYRRLTQLPRVLRIALRPKPPKETAALPLLVGPGAIAFDIGANYGQYVRVLAPLVGAYGAVHAFEPSAITLSGLRLMARLLRWRNVQFHALALANEIGNRQLHIPVKDSGHLGIGLAHLATGQAGPGIRETVQVTTLDRFVEEHGIRRCDLIKCDVEGAELLVLQGGRRTLERLRPTLILEVKAAQLARFGNSVGELETLLRELNYDFYVWRGGRLESITMLDESPNFIFRPRG
jgi:FkbM family methyltransferase